MATGRGNGCIGALAKAGPDEFSIVSRSIASRADSVPKMSPSVWPISGSFSARNPRGHSTGGSDNRFDSIEVMIGIDQMRIVVAPIRAADGGRVLLPPFAQKLLMQLRIAPNRHALSHARRAEERQIERLFAGEKKIDGRRPRPGEQFANRRANGRVDRGGSRTLGHSVRSTSAAVLPRSSRHGPAAFGP